MSGILPMIAPRVEGEARPLPMYRDVLWDMERHAPVYRDGRPVWAEGNAALRGWIWRALMTARYRHEIHTWDYGSRVEELIGKSYSTALKRAEGPRYVREALMINPYITSVAVKKTEFIGDRLTMHVAVTTIYGEVEMDV